jgi:OmpA-OmpF porin, OOP family
LKSFDLLTLLVQSLGSEQLKKPVREGPMRPLFPAFLMLCLVPGLGFAQERGVDIQLFRPAVDSRGLLTKNRSDTLGRNDVSFGLWLNFADAPLVVDNDEITEQLLTTNFQASFGVLKFLEVGVSLPFSVVDGPEVDPLGGGTLAAQGVGDIGFHIKGRILRTRQNAIGLGALLGVYVPSGDDQNFLSSGVVTLAPQFIADTLILRRLKLTVNAGAFIRGEDGEITDAAGNQVLAVGNQLHLGAGAGYTLVTDRLDVVGELSALTPLADPFAGGLDTPIEAIGGFKLFLQRNSFLTVGVGAGLDEGYGAPNIRVFGGITFEPLIGDRDGDGFKDNEDKCPLEPEDYDGFQDEDGCPEEDNDDDGILDEDDKCPNEPGVEERKGCPIPPPPKDSDGDGMLDNDDKCPLEAEDFDGFQDEDGCPEEDNDKDGILDGNDECPLEAEDKDRFQDEDGCPEKDNDKDSILDIDDKCPDIKGVKENFGCPKDRKIKQSGNTFTTEPVLFDVGKATIKKDSFKLLKELADTLKENTQINLLRVEGHTDSDGSDASNDKLSNDRVKAVVDHLVSVGGVDKKRLAFKGYGEGCPIATNATAAGKTKNRRVEFVILEATDEPTGECNAKKTGQSPQ